MRQKALFLSLAAVSFAGLSCDSATRPLTTGGISIVLLTPAGAQMSFGANARAEQANATANVTLTSVRVTVAGPTPKTITSNTPSGGNFILTVTDLDAGSYTVSVEGLVNGEVSNFGQTSSVQVTAGQNTTASVTFLTFQPTIQSPTVVDTSDVLHYTVNFGAVTGATSYIVAWSLNADMSGASTKTVTTTSADIVVTTEGKYFVTVRAVNSIVTAGGMASPAKAVFVFQGVAVVTVTPAAPTIAAGATQQLTAEARDGDNNVVSNVTFFWASDNQAAARVSQTGLATGMGGGTATITALGKGMPGSITLTVTASPAPPAQKLAFSIQPANAIAGDPLSPAIQVEVQDAAGNRIGNSRDAVTIVFANNAGGGTLTGTKTVNAISGIASFTGLSINKAAAGYTLSANSGALTGTTSGSFTISPAAPAKLAFSTQPINAQGNVAIGSGVTVTIADAFDNFVSTATNSVTLSIANNPWKTNLGAGGTVSANQLVVAAVAGVASFSNVRVDKPAPGYTLAATSGSLTPATSASFNVNLTISSVNAGTSSSHTCAIATGGAYCWGNNSSQQLGAVTGFVTFDSVAALVRGGLAFTSVTAGGAHSCGVTDTGAAFCWGAGNNGRLGNGGTANSDVPVPVSGGHVFQSIDAGSAHTCGITTASGTPAEDRQVYCWGVGSSGQLGDGASPFTVQALVPVRVVEPLQTANRAIAISAGSSHTCVLTNSVSPTSGAAFCWGANFSGQVGNGVDFVSTSVPTQVAGGFVWTSIAAGSNHSCGISTGGAPAGNIARCWGFGGTGQLGDNFTGISPNPSSTFSPVTVGGTSPFTTWTRVSTGGSHSCGIAGGLTLCWGQDFNGELGDDDQAGATKFSPVLVAGGLTFLSVDAGANHSCGRTASAVFCWGTNSVGRLGSPGVNQIKRAPTQIIQ